MAKEVASQLELAHRRVPSGVSVLAALSILLTNFSTLSRPQLLQDFTEQLEINRIGMIKIELVGMCERKFLGVVGMVEGVLGEDEDLVLGNMRKVLEERLGKRGL